MEQYGWQNVRGGEFIGLEDERAEAKINHIYDTFTNKIKYYIPDCKLLFGASDDWLVYMLELQDGFYYIGSGKRLGKALGDHFNSNTISWTREHPSVGVAEWQLIKPEDGHYLTFKRNLTESYRIRYGKEKVIGGNLN